MIILVHGKDQEEHDSRLRQVLQRLKLAGVTLNRNKCEFSRKSLKFLGHIIGENGLKPDLNKVKAINSFLRPGTVTDVRRFLGMTNQLGKFLPKLSDVTKPIRELISRQNIFHWGPGQESAFQEVKHILSSAPVLALYDM